jgi:hypothetical protein
VGHRAVTCNDQATNLRALASADLPVYQRPTSKARPPKMKPAKSVPIAAAALALFVAGCAGAGSWQREGVTDAERNAHLAACEREARKVTERDALIDQDIESAQEMNFGTLPTTQGLSQSNRFGEEKRVDRMVQGCMRRLGYQWIGDDGWL